MLSAVVAALLLMVGRHIVAESFLAAHPAKRWVHDRLVELITSETVVPAFSLVVTKLTAMTRDENTSLEDIADLVALDQGLSTRCLRAANAPSSGGQAISNIQDWTKRNASHRDDGGCHG